jgi:acetyl-CoA C-acetyltransferase
MKISLDDVLKSEMIADPLRKLDCSPVSDGCCAIIIANESVAAKFKRKPIWVKGLSFCTDSFFFGDRDLARSSALAQAAGNAYRMAGIKDPKNEIDLVELYDAFTYQELLWLEEMGLAEYGKAANRLKKGEYNLDGRLPVNPSGGLLAGHPVIAAGLYRIAEVVLQLRGEAGEHQVGKAKTGLAHGVNGLCGQSHCVWILDQEK